MVKPRITTINTIKAKPVYYERRIPVTDCEPHEEVVDRDVCLTCTEAKCNDDCERAKQARKQALKSTDVKTLAPDDKTS